MDPLYKYNQERSVAKILIILDLVVGLEESVEVDVRGFVFEQPLDYINVLFSCPWFHNYGHGFEEYAKEFKKQMWKPKSFGLSP